MKVFTWSFATLFIATAFLTPQIARAQPNEAPPQTEVQARVQERNAAAERAMQEMVDKFKKMTPDQLRDYDREMRENALRSNMTDQGFNDLELQDIVINFLRQQEASHGDLRAIAVRLRDALDDKNTPTEQFAPLLAELEKAAAAQQVRREQDSAKLAQTLKLDEQPRVEAMLHLNGFIGDEMWSLGDSSNGIGAVGALPVPDAELQFDPDGMKKAATKGREIFETFAAMTDEQYRDYIRKNKEDRWRETLTHYGFGDDKTQNAILAWLRAQEEARGEIRVISARVRDSIAKLDTDNFKLLQLLAHWQELAANESVRRTQASAQLRQTLNLDANPRLNAFLHLYGIVGDEAWQFSNALSSNWSLTVLPTKDEIRALAVK